MRLLLLLLLLPLLLGSCESPSESPHDCSPGVDLADLCYSPDPNYEPIPGCNWRVECRNSFDCIFTACVYEGTVKRSTCVGGWCCYSRLR